MCFSYLCLLFPSVFPSAAFYLPRWVIVLSFRCRLISGFKIGNFQVPCFQVVSCCLVALSYCLAFFKKNRGTVCAAPLLNHILCVDIVSLDWQVLSVSLPAQRQVGIPWTCFSVQNIFCRFLKVQRWRLSEAPNTAH